MIYPKVYVTGHKEKSISRYPICLTDSDYDHILEEVGRWDKIEFERDVEVYSDDEENWYEHFKWILYAFIICLYINYHQIYLFIYFPWCQFDVFKYLYVCIVIYYSSIHIHFYSENVGYELVVELMYIDYYFFRCSYERVYLTEKKSVSIVATCF